MLRGPRGCCRVRSSPPAPCRDRRGRARRCRCRRARAAERRDRARPVLPAGPSARPSPVPGGRSPCGGAGSVARLPARRRDDCAGSGVVHDGFVGHHGQTELVVSGRSIGSVDDGVACDLQQDAAAREHPQPALRRSCEGGDAALDLDGGAAFQRDRVEASECSVGGLDEVAVGTGGDDRRCRVSRRHAVGELAGGRVDAGELSVGHDDGVVGPDLDDSLAAPSSTMASSISTSGSRVSPFTCTAESPLASQALPLSAPARDTW